MANNIVTIFVVVAAVAIVLQMVILFALYMGLRKTSERMEGIAGRLEQQATPVLTTAAAILEDARPKIADITANLAETSTAIRNQVSDISEATGEIVERVRMQAARLDDLLQIAARKVEDASEIIHTKVMSPVRRVRAIMTALNAGLSYLKSNRHQRNHSDGVEDEEMFI